MGFNNQLRQFLKQAETDNLKTKHYESEYNGLEVKVSFGQGNTAKIPWISFLKEPNQTSKGIYPVYLYYKEFDLLILAYGISETNLPDQTWDIKEAKSISDYFENENQTKPDRYGDSLVFRIYNVNNLPEGEQLDNDLNEILSQYDLNMTMDKPRAISNLNEDYEQNILNEDLTKAGLIYSNILLVRFSASLLTKPFVILTGLSFQEKPN